MADKAESADCLTVNNIHNELARCELANITQREPVLNWSYLEKSSGARNVRMCLFVISFLVIGHQCAKAAEPKSVSANGTEFAYVEMGQGEPVIFVHGGLQDYRMWQGHLAEFAERYRVVGETTTSTLSVRKERQTVPPMLTGKILLPW